MPIYEYRCADCSEVFEVFQKMHDAPLTQCRFCDGKVEKLISHSSFQLRGSGWYLTDYARKSQPADSGSSQKESGKSTDSSKTESKGNTDNSPKSSGGTPPSKSSE